MSWYWVVLICLGAFAHLNQLSRIADGMDAVSEMAKLLTKQARRDDERKAKL